MRIASAAVLAPLAIAAAWLGGLPFVAFWTVAAIAILFEWQTTVGDPQPAMRGWGMIGIASAAASAVMGRGLAAVFFIAFGAALEAMAASQSRFRVWAAAGALYAGSLLGSCLVLRADASFGFTAIVFLFAIVWATDILAYFVGRLVGGPRLAPSVSPNKTWSGAIGGACGAIAAGIAVAHYAQLASLAPVAGVALVLSIASQAGDLFESAFKRRFGVKDSGHLIPGHGGVMDRLDGFLAAAAVAAAIGLVRGGLDGPARGLLVW